MLTTQQTSELVTNRAAARFVLAVFFLLYFCAPLPAQFTTVINVPPDVSPASLESNSQLNVSTGGRIDNGLEAGGVDTENIEVNVLGGEIVGPFLAGNGTTVNIADGAINHGGGGFLVPSLGANAGSQINLTGGQIGLFFKANQGSIVNIEGGRVSSRFTADGAQVNISDGTIDDFFVIQNGAVVHMSGGTIDRDLRINSGSEFNLSGGAVAGDLHVNQNGVLVVTGGNIDEVFGARSNLEINEGGTARFSGGTVRESVFGDSDSALNISGGLFLNHLDTSGTTEISGGTFGGSISSSVGDNVTLVGGDFRLDGVSLGSLGSTVPVNIGSGSVLSGTLASGQPFAFTSFDSERFADGTVMLNTVPLQTFAPSITLPGDPVPIGIRSGQKLTVLDGGTIGNLFNADWNSEVEVTGGQVGDKFEVVGSKVTISAGSIGDDFDAFQGSEVNVAGGEVGEGLRVIGGSTLNISAGTVGSDGAAVMGSEVNISGGTVVGTFQAYSGSELNISGGTVGHFVAREGSLANVTGGEIGSFNARDFGSVVDIRGVNVTNGFTSTSNGTVNIYSGLVGPSSSARGGTVNFFGGSTGDGFEVSISGELNVFDGSLGNGVLVTSRGTLNVEGGIVGDSVLVEDHAMLTIESGTIGNNLTAEDSSIVNINGGIVGQGFRANTGSAVTISGGLVENGMVVSRFGSVNIGGGTIGDEFQVLSNGVMNLFGSSFEIRDLTDGTLIEDLTPTLQLDQTKKIRVRDVLLTGIYSDGTPFSFQLNSTPGLGDYFHADSILRITLGDLKSAQFVPEPSTLIFCILASSTFALCKRRL